MKISALACVLICFLAAPESTKCQGFGGLQRTGIVIENLDQGSVNMGLNPESLKDQILVALKRDIPKLKIVERPQSLSWVDLEITTIQPETNWVAAFVSVSLHRKGEIFGDDDKPYFTDVAAWKTGALLWDSPERMPTHIRDQISQAMTAFAAEYYKQNP